MAYRFGDFVLEPRRHRLRRGNEEFPLRPKTFETLLYLVEHPDRVVTKEDLLQNVWADAYVVEAVIAHSISELRAVLGEDVHLPRYIKTVPRVGYKFIAEVATLESGEREILGDEGGVGPTRPSAGRPKTLKKGPIAGHWIWIGLVAVLGLAAAFWFFLPGRPTSSPELTPLPLTALPGREGHPTFSADGTQVAFHWSGERQENQDIFVRQVESGQPLRRTTDPRVDCNPTWSPDGSRIAFFRELGGQKWSLLTVPPVTGVERRLAEVFFPSSVGIQAAWTPDGGALIVPDCGSSEGTTHALYLIRLDTHERTRLTVPPADITGDVAPALSPDGRTLAFVRTTELRVGDVYLLPLDGHSRPVGEPSRLTVFRDQTWGLTWTGDGQEIILAAGVWPSSRLYRIPLKNGAEPRPMSTLGQGLYDPAISWRSRRLAYTREPYDFDIWRMEIRRPGKEPGEPIRLISSSRVDWQPQYSRDGKRIAFVSTRAGANEIWICEGDGSGWSPLARSSSLGPESKVVNPLDWSPDDRRIAFGSFVRGNFDIYVIAAQGGPARQLTTNPADDELPVWSPDGRWIYFGSKRSGEWQIWKIPAEGGEVDAVQITHGGGHFAHISPDGRSIYYTKIRGPNSAIWRVSSQGGEETKLDCVAYENFFQVVDQGIYFLRRFPGSFKIDFYEFATGKTRQIAEIEKEFAWGFNLSPDERFILYAQYENRRADLMLVEDFQ